MQFAPLFCLCVFRMFCADVCMRMLPATLQQILVEHFERESLPLPGSVLEVMARGFGGPGGWAGLSQRSLVP